MDVHGLVEERKKGRVALKSYLFFVGSSSGEGMRMGNRQMSELGRSGREGWFVPKGPDFNWRRTAQKADMDCLSGHVGRWGYERQGKRL